MTNWKLIDAAVQLVVEFNEFSGRVETTENIRNRVLDWYNNTDVTDVEMIAAAALHGSYSPSISYKDLTAAKEYYFPSEPNKYSVGDFEKSYRDCLWM